MDDGSRRSRLRAFGRRYPPRAAIGDAWDEHRNYVAFAAGLFGLGILLGAALAFAGYNLLELALEYLGENPLGDVEDEELTARFFIVNNSLPYFLSIAGAVSLGLYTAFVMVFNGVIVGNIGVAVTEAVGIDFLLVGILPHGVFELPALFIAAGVGFRLFHRFGQRVLGRRDAFLTKPYLYRTALLVVVGWLMLALAAVIEAHVTPALLDALFPDIENAVGGTNESANATTAVVTAVPFAFKR